MSDLEKNLSNLLSKVGDGYERAKRERENGEREGKYYNVFNALGIQKKELRHSAFIADLLNPNGAHGAGDKFLRAFLKRVPIKDTKKHLKEDYLSVKPGRVNVCTEFPVDNGNGRIDIIAEDGENAIIIENKIDAEDREGQLFRYYNYAKEREEKGILRDYKLIYLTKYGQKPSKDSTRDNEEVKRDCICMSYEKHIIPWLNECLGIASTLPVKDIINQYIYVIEVLTQTTMKDKELYNIAEIAVKYHDSTLALLEAQDNGKISYVFVKRFIFEPLRKEFESEFDVEIGKYNSFHYIRLSKKKWKDGYIYIMSNNKTSWKWKDVFISVAYEKKKFIGKKLRNLKEDPDEDNPYGWEWVYGDRTNTEDKPAESDWDSLSSFDDMINEKKILKWLIDKIKDIRDELGNRDDIDM